MLNIVKNKIKSLIKKFLREKGFIVQTLKYHNTIEKYITSLSIAANDSQNIEIASIVFSKNRAMQLHAFLSTYLEKVNVSGKMYILYKASNERHKSSYEELKKIFAQENFLFVEEMSFRKQLINICEESECGKILFYVDDMIFTHQVDYDAIRKIDTSRYVLALSRGKDMDYSVVLDKPLQLPKFHDKIYGLESFNWNDFEDFNDWTFPTGVSGYMYGSTEVLAMLNATDFKAPNSLEGALMKFMPYFINRFGLCYEATACVCVHANIVQTEGINPVLGTFSIEELLNQWEAGKMINIKEFYDHPLSSTQVQRYTFVDRS